MVGWLGREVFLFHAQAAEFVFEVVAAAFAAGERVVNTMPLSVRVEAGIPYVATVCRKVSATIGPVTRIWAVTDKA